MQTVATLLAAGAKIKVRAVTGDDAISMVPLLKLSKVITKNMCRICPEIVAQQVRLSCLFKSMCLVGL